MRFLIFEYVILRKDQNNKDYNRSKKINFIVEKLRVLGILITFDSSNFLLQVEY